MSDDEESYNCSSRNEKKRKRTDFQEHVDDDDTTMNEEELEEDNEENQFEEELWNPDENRDKCTLENVSSMSGRKKKPFKIISTWNFKGGVGKTTTTFSIGYALALQGKRVLFVDADPQMNLTETAMSFELNREVADKDVFTRLDDLNATDNLYKSLIKCRQGIDIKAASVINLKMVYPGTIEEQDSELMQKNGAARNERQKSESERNKGQLYLLPGSMDCAELDEFMSEGYSNLQKNDATRNYPGAFYSFIKKTAQAHSIDYVLVDCSPASGSFNRTILFSSNIFIMPCKADSFSKQALKVLTSKLPEWYEKYNEFREHYKTDSRGQEFPIKYKLPNFNVQFGGCPLIGFEYSTTDLKPKSYASQNAISRLEEEVTRFYNVLPLEMLERNQDNHNPEVKDRSKIIAKVPNFNQLGLMAQRSSIPAPYLPNIYLKVQKNGKWVNAKHLKSIKENRKRQRIIIEDIVKHIQAIIDDE
eukprot:gene8244-8914_t